MNSLKKPSLPIVVLLSLLLLAFANVALAQGTIETTFTAEPAEATVGDPVQMTLSVTHPTGYFVIAPQLDEQWGDFMVVGKSAATTTDNGDGTETTSVTYETRLFAPGAFITPPLAYTVTDGAGNLFEFTAEPIGVNVNSVLVEGDTTLRDIKPQVEIPVATWLYLLGGALLLGLIGGGLFWFARRRKAVPPAVDNRTPYERVRDDLSHVAALNLPAEGRFNEHYTLVSDSVRRFMGVTYAIPVLERTTAEIQADLRTSSIDPTLRQRFVAFLQESDLVKFANFQPDPSDASNLLTEAEAIVESAHAAAVALPANDDDAGSGGAPGAALPTVEATFSENGYNATEKVPQ